MADTSYYQFLGTTAEGHERFATTQATVSIWGPTLQHGAPRRHCWCVHSSVVAPARELV